MMYLEYHAITEHDDKKKQVQYSAPFDDKNPVDQNSRPGDVENAVLMWV